VLLARGLPEEALAATYRGEAERAFAALTAAFDAADPAPLEIASDSYHKPLHRDPRYQALLRRLKLPQQA
jgi:hypothetical protein